MDYTGGVIAIREDVYVKCNGFSNLYFGWGGEDDDFGYRYDNLMVENVRQIASKTTPISENANITRID